MSFHGLIEYYSVVKMISCLLPTERHLGDFQVLAILYKAAIDIHVQVFVWTYTFNPLV